MEVAGLVLAAAPLAIEALKCYKAGRELTDLVRNRKRHIKTLVCALKGNNAVLEINIVWLLKTIGIYEADNTAADIPYMIQTPSTLDAIENFLGRQVSDAFQNAILEGHEALLEIAQSIRGLLPREYRIENKASLTPLLRMQS